MKIQHILYTAIIITILLLFFTGKTNDWELFGMTGFMVVVLKVYEVAADEKTVEFEQVELNTIIPPPESIQI